MTALVRYLLADLLRTQRYLPPLLVYAAVLAVFNGGDAGPPPSSYAGSCAFLYPVAVWLTVVVATAEDPVRRAVTVVAAGGWGRSQAAVSVLSCLLVTVVAAFAAVLPVLTQGRSYPPGTVALGFASLLVCGVVGVGVGVLCARPVITRHGWSVPAAAALVVLAYLFGQAPPIGNVLGALGHEHDLAPHLAVSGVCAAALVVGATWLSRTLGPRRN
ncbi:hypothetical protein AB0I60_13945 [Actinosynnema sp. NPDC050436]|uniref:hypothetical protein n=1 Tax=Actinosynnema sp. NPDC050436 TaxID=3155659 RepID=UPI0033C65315